MTRHDLQKALVLAAAGTAVVLATFVIRGLGPELVRFARVRRM